MMIEYIKRENGSTIEETQTNSDGEYEIETVEDGEIVVNAEGEDEVDGNSFYRL